MTTLTTTLCNPTVRHMYQRLRADGKAFKSVMVACARRLLGILNAVVKNNRRRGPQPA